MEVQLQLSENELTKLQESYMEPGDNREKTCCTCAPATGLHILLLTMLFIPCAALASIVMSFYIGTIAWYYFSLENY